MPYCASISRPRLEVDWIRNVCFDSYRFGNALEVEQSKDVCRLRAREGRERDIMIKHD